MYFFSGKERREHRVKKIWSSPSQELKTIVIDDQPPNKKFEKVAREFVEVIEYHSSECEI